VVRRHAGRDTHVVGRTRASGVTTSGRTSFGTFGSGRKLLEYYSDLDEIVDEQLWKPEAMQAARGLYNWGPPPRRRSSGPKTSPH